jgi:ring-1,2-phenylacetyl-CoA epoxidase subunit PaaB
MPKNIQINNEMSEIKDTQGELWEVFIQVKKGLPFKHVGSVHAYDKEMAVQNARDLYTRRGEGRGLWVVPANSIVAVDPSDDSSFFDSADDKVYRHPTFYELPEGIKNM